jgi:ferric-dicitrate binding protein FerR (iron transport regulator)
MTKIEHDALAELLKQSRPRPAPPAEQTAAARAELYREWRELSGRNRLRRRWQTVAVAATVLVGVFAALLALRPPTTAVVPVATIDRTFGTVYLLGDDAELRATPHLATVFSGQTIVTAKDAGLAVAWGTGGSLRVDGNTRVRFTDESRAYLENGRVYFDSTPAVAAGNGAHAGPAFMLETPAGAVNHIGTQYMAEIDEERLVVSVREGEVQIDGSFHDQRLVSGQQATLSGSRRPTILSISRSGSYWDWVARTTPAADVDGWTLYRFLGWAGRELGLDVRFDGEAESIARSAILRGTIDTQPADALRLRLATAGLNWHLEEGVLYISD